MATTDDVQERLAKASAQGDLGKTPFPHLLVYIHKRKLSGTLEVNDGPLWHSIYFNAGSPAKAQLGTEILTLGSLLVQDQVITQAQLDTAVETSHREHKLLGRVLVETGAIDPSRLIRYLHKQLRAQVVFLFGLEEGMYGFYQDQNRLLGSGGEEIIVTEPYEILMQGLRKHGRPGFLNLLLQKLEGAHFFVDKAEELRQFEFTEAERHFVRTLTHGTATLDSIAKVQGLDEVAKRRVLYALLGTGLLKFGEKETGKSSVPGHGVLGPLDTAMPRASMAESEMDAETLAFRKEVKEKALAMASQNYFEMLGVERDAEQTVIRKAFFELAKKYHPDKFSSPALNDLADLTEYIFTNISEANACLSNPDTLDEYRRRLETKGLVPTEEEEEIRAILAAESSYQKALIHYKKRDYRLAKKMVEQAVEKNPQNGEYLSLAIWIRSMEDGARANVTRLILDMAQALKLAPESEQANFFMGQLLKKAGRLTEAADYFQKVSRKNPRHLDAQRELRLLVKTGSSVAAKPNKTGSLFDLIKSKMK